MKKSLKLGAMLVLPFMGLFMNSCEKSQYVIGICQLVKHEALDAATRGFMDAVEEGLGKDHVKFDLQNAANDSATCVTIANSFVSKNVDLIMANATPALQAAANSTLTIPILGTSITEYGAALGINDFTGVVGSNVSGTSDLAPLNEQAQMIIDVFPTAKKVGLLYCSAENNSLYQINVVEKYLNDHNIETRRLSFSDSNDIAGLLDTELSNVDLVYTPTDNTVASCTEIVDAKCRSKNIPVVAGEEGICKGCGAITLSISYYELGKKTGEMAVDILKNNADISKMPIAYDEHPVKKYNKEICDALGIVINTEEYQAI